MSLRDIIKLLITIVGGGILVSIFIVAPVRGEFFWSPKVDVSIQPNYESSITSTEIQMLNTTDYALERVRLKIDTVENVIIFPSGEIENCKSKTWKGHYKLKANEPKTRIFSLTYEHSLIPPKGYNPLKAIVIVSDNPEDKDTIFFYVDDYNQITWIKGEVGHEKDFLEIYVDRLKKGIGMYP